MTACKAGCAFCCYIPVGAKEVEARAVWEACDQKRVRHNLATVSDGRDFSPCPLLDRKRRVCTVYEDRPSACRQYTSESRTACKRAHKERNADALIPVDMNVMNHWKAKRAGLPGPERLLVDWLRELSNGC